MAKQQLSPIHRKAIWFAYNHRCFYCRTPISWDQLRIDHVIPESLIKKPDDLVDILTGSGLPNDWNLCDDHNLVASCEQCNALKSDSVPKAEQLILWLTKISEKLENVYSLREKFATERKSGLLLAQLETALATGLLTEAEVEKAKAAAAGGEDLVELTSRLEFLNGIKLDRLQPSLVEELLDKPIKFGASLPEGLKLQKDNETVAYVRTAREYRAARKEGFYANTTFDMKMEAFAINVLGVLKALASCRPSEKSFIRAPRVGLCDIELIPASILLRLGEETDETRKIVSDGSSVGKLVRSGHARVISVSSNSVDIEFHGMGTHLREMLRADLDGDGVEDLLATLYGHATGGTLGIGSEPIAFSRKSFSEGFAVTECIATAYADL